MTDGPKTEGTSFMEKLQALINEHSMESGSNTPDFILANFMGACLRAFNEATLARTKWYGGDGHEAAVLSGDVRGLPTLPQKP